MRLWLIATLLLLTGCSGSFFPGPKLLSISIAPNDQPDTIFHPGGFNRYVATGTYDDGSLKDVTSTSTWSSSDTSIATVDQHGVITAQGVGRATITVTKDDISDSLNITVLSFTP